MTRILRHRFSSDQFQPHPSLWTMNHSAISNPKGWRPRQAPHHRHSSGVLASQHGAGRSRSCHPGRSRWDLPIVPHTCRRQSNEGASIFRDRPLQQKLQCPHRLFDHHTAGEERRKRKGKGGNKMKGDEIREEKEKKRKRKTLIQTVRCGEGE